MRDLAKEDRETINCYRHRRSRIELHKNSGFVVAGYVREKIVLIYNIRPYK